MAPSTAGGPGHETETDAADAEQHRQDAERTRDQRTPSRPRPRPIPNSHPTKVTRIEAMPASIDPTACPDVIGDSAA